MSISAKVEGNIVICLVGKLFRKRAREFYELRNAIQTADTRIATSDFVVKESVVNGSEESAGRWRKVLAS